jgi:hypothetical protein
MAWTKRQLIEEAFDNIGLGGYAFEATPSELASGLRKLDMMMGSWESQGIRVGYSIPSGQDTSDISTSMNIPDSAAEAIAANLAIRIAPSFGKAVPIELKYLATDSYNSLLTTAVTPVGQQFPATLPAGAGNKTFRQTRQTVLPPTDPLEAGGDGNLDFL